MLSAQLAEATAPKRTRKFTIDLDIDGKSYEVDWEGAAPPTQKDVEAISRQVRGVRAPANADPQEDQSGASVFAGAKAAGNVSRNVSQANPKTAPEMRPRKSAPKAASPILERLADAQPTSKKLLKPRTDADVRRMAQDAKAMEEAQRRKHEARFLAEGRPFRTQDDEDAATLASIKAGTSFGTNDPMAGRSITEAQSAMTAKVMERLGIRPDDVIGGMVAGWVPTLMAEVAQLGTAKDAKTALGAGANIALNVAPLEIVAGKAASKVAQLLKAAGKDKAAQIAHGLSEPLQTFLRSQKDPYIDGVLKAAKSQKVYGGTGTQGFQDIAAGRGSQFGDTEPGVSFRKIPEPVPVTTPKGTKSTTKVKPGNILNNAERHSIRSMSDRDLADWYPSVKEAADNGDARSKEILAVLVSRLRSSKHAEDFVRTQIDGLPSKELSTEEAYRRSIESLGGKVPDADAPGAPTPANTPSGRRLYREGGLDEWLYGDYRNPGSFWTDNPDLAIAQGSNRGVIYEFEFDDAARLRENVKPGTQVPGVGKEFVVQRNPTISGRPMGRLVSITVKKGATADKGTLANLRNFSDPRNPNRQYYKETLPNGDTRYTFEPPEPEPVPVNTPEAQPVKEVGTTQAKPKAGAAEEYIRDIADEGGRIQRSGNVVSVAFTPRLAGVDIVDAFPDDWLNPNSFRGAAELSIRETYRKTGGPQASAALSNAVNQGMLMQEIDKLRFVEGSGIVKVNKRGGEPFKITFTDEASAKRFEDAFLGNERLPAHEGSATTVAQSSPAVDAGYAPTAGVASNAGVAKPGTQAGTAAGRSGHISPNRSETTRADATPSTPPEPPKTPETAGGRADAHTAEGGGKGDFYSEPAPKPSEMATKDILNEVQTTTNPARAKALNAELKKRTTGGGGKTPPPPPPDAPGSAGPPEPETPKYTGPNPSRNDTGGDQYALGLGKVERATPPDAQPSSWADRFGDTVTNLKLTLNPFGRLKDIKSNITRHVSETALTPAKKGYLNILKAQGLTDESVTQGVPWAKSGLFDEGFWAQVKSEIKDVWKGADPFSDKKFGNAGLGRKIAGTGDVPFRETYYRSYMRDWALSDILKRKGKVTDAALKEAISTAPHSVHERAMNHAAEMTFNADNALGDAALASRNYLRRKADSSQTGGTLWRTAQALVDASTRFSRVIGNVAQDKLRYSPAGLVEGLIKYGEAVKVKKGGGTLTFDEARKLAEVLSKGTVGSAGMVAGYLAWKNGAKHGRVVESDRSAYLDQGMAEQAISGLGVPYMVGQQLAFLDDRRKSTAGKSDDMGAIEAVVAELARISVDSPFFNSADMIAGIRDRKALDIFGGLILQQMPTTEIAKRADAINTYGWEGLIYDRPIKKAGSDKPLLERLGQQGMQYIPGMRGYLPTKTKTSKPMDVDSILKSWGSGGAKQAEPMDVDSILKAWGGGG